MGILEVNLLYDTALGENDTRRYCLAARDGTESPTLHVRPGDHLVIHVTNKLPHPSAEHVMSMASRPSTSCGAGQMDSSSMNIHFHGLNASPTCHQDEVIHTLVNSGDTFDYDVAIPPDEPPGLYWYHPHVHGNAEQAVLGGASGAIIVDGMERFQPAILGLRERVFVIRDQLRPDQPPPGNIVPAWDLSLNYVPIIYPQESPGIVQMTDGQEQFWRVVNASANTIVDLALTFDGVAQTLQLAALDGVPLGSQEGSGHAKLLPVKDIRLPPAGRAEFIVAPPPKSVKIARLFTTAIDTGTTGDSDPERPLALIQTSTGAAAMAQPISSGPATTWSQRFFGLTAAPVTKTRVLFFSQKGEEFYITPDGQEPTPFSATNPPSVVTHQGAVEEWIVQNRASENHEFHIHQIHFQLASEDNFQINGAQPVPALQGQMLDTVDLPAWDGKVTWDGKPLHPYPIVRLKMDFRGPDVGDFVFHCHILNHEDRGMMAIIRVLPH